jgi:hypothetical protein
MTEASQHRWSKKVTTGSDALDLENGIFEKNDPTEIAQSLKHSADRSARRKGSSYRSAMSMLTFYINRAGHSLPEKRKKILENAKVELRKQYGR